MPDESDTALLYVDRGLVRADQGPPDQRAQRRAHTRSRASRWARWAIPVVLILVVLAALVPGSSGPVLWITGPVLVLATGAAVLVLTRAARVAQAVAGLPVPIEVSGKVAPAMRSVLAMTRGIAGQRAVRRSRAAAEGVVLLRHWSGTSDELRAAWLRGDIAAWHDHARALVEAGARAERLRTDVESDG